MVILDITNPSDPVIVGSTGSSVYGENVTVNGNIAGLTDYGQITFYDITNPLSPVKKGSTGSFTTGNEGFAIEGSYAFVPDGDSLKIYNITDLNSPLLVSKIYTGGYGYTADVEGSYCYVASEGTGVRAINISNPSVPVEEGFYDDVPRSRGLTANGKYIYVAEMIDGLTVYSNDLVTSILDESSNIPESITLHQNYPNPFNPVTNIIIELKEKTDVMLEVFNSLGERVAVLLNKELPSGSTSISFDGSSLSSGIYLYRLSVNGSSLGKKMVLMK
jgi:hypothetical protein